MLRRHYKCLVGCLPDDHFVTLSALSNIIRVNDFFFDKTLNYTNSKRANKNILNLLIMMLSDDKDISGFCKVLRDVIGNKSLTAGFLQFQIGKSYIHKTEDLQCNCITLRILMY